MHTVTLLTFVGGVHGKHDVVHVVHIFRFHPSLPPSHFRTFLPKRLGAWMAAIFALGQDEISVLNPGDSVSKQKTYVYFVFCVILLYLIVSVASCGFASYFCHDSTVTQLPIFSDETNSGPNYSIFRQTSLWSWGGSWSLIVFRCCFFFNTLSQMLHVGNTYLHLA